MEDLSCIEAIKNGDSKAFNLFFKSYYQPLVAYINTFTNDIFQAEDIVQQTFINLWEKRTALGQIKSPKNYLYTSAYNNFIDQCRKSKRKDLFFEELREKILRELISENKEYLDSKIKRLKTLISELPPKCREILELNKMSGFNYKEIANKLDISEKTVEAQMGIAFKKIRKGFEKNDLFLFLVLQDSR